MQHAIGQTMRSNLILLGLLVLALLTANYYHGKAAQHAAQVATLTQAAAKQAEILAHYQAQQDALKEQLAELSAHAETRRQQLKDALNNAKNKTWTNERVPDDVGGLFYQRTRPTGATNLPADNRVQSRTAQH